MLSAFWWCTKNAMSGLQQIRSPAKISHTQKKVSVDGNKKQLETEDESEYKAVNGGVETVGQFYRCERVVEAVDTTGAGDSFLGAFAAHLSRGSEVDIAIRAALHIATHSVCGQGAQQSYVRSKDLDGKYRVPA